MARKQGPLGIKKSKDTIAMGKGADKVLSEVLTGIDALAAITGAGAAAKAAVKAVKGVAKGRKTAKAARSLAGKVEAGPQRKPTGKRQGPTMEAKGKEDVEYKLGYKPRYKGDPGPQGIDLDIPPPRRQQVAKPKRSRVESVGKGSVHDRSAIERVRNRRDAIQREIKDLDDLADDRERYIHQDPSRKADRWDPYLSKKDKLRKKDLQAELYKLEERIQRHERTVSDLSQPVRTGGPDRGEVGDMLREGVGRAAGLGALYAAAQPRQRSMGPVVQSAMDGEEARISGRDWWEKGGRDIWVQEAQRRMERSGNTAAMSEIGHGATEIDEALRDSPWMTATDARQMARESMEWQDLRNAEAYRRKPAGGRARGVRTGPVPGSKKN